MIKGISFLRPAGSAAVYRAAGELLFGAGICKGGGWKDDTSGGASFLAPLGNLEFVDGKFPSVADVMVEVTALDAAHQAAQAWLRAQGDESRMSAFADHGNTLEVAHLYR